MTTKKPILLDDLTRAAWRSAIRKAWDGICYDCLNAAPNHEMTAAEIQEVVADYVDDREWWTLSHEDRNKLLAEALPFDQAI